MREKSQPSDDARMVAILLGFAKEDGAFPTALPGLQVVRKSQVPDTRHVMDSAKICYVAQGAKAVFYGGRRLVYDPNTILVLPISLPLIGEIVDAKPFRPMLSVSISLDLGEVADVARAMPQMVCEAKHLEARVVQPITEQLRDTLYRYVNLLREPAAIPVLGSTMRRELLYRLLEGPEGNHLRSLVIRRSEVHRIGKAVAWFRQHAFEPIAMRDLAGQANMSEQSMFKSFRMLTSMSPLQFQKQLRLHEARRLLLSGIEDVAVVGYRVGYKSPAEFSREYNRLFESPPKRDILRILAQESTRTAGLRSKDAELRYPTSP